MKTQIQRIFGRSFGAFLTCATVAVVPMSPAGTLTPGQLGREVYTNVPGMFVADLTNSAKFPGSPDVVDKISIFETPMNFGDNYGQRLSGYLLPPITGQYTFYIASDDQGILYLSSDRSPANKVKIAQESGWVPPRTWTGGRPSAENTSLPIRLEAGQAYYVEALHKEGGGGDNFGVAWQLPGGLPPENGSEPIAGQYLATMDTTPTDPGFSLSFFSAGSAASNQLVFTRRYSLAGPEQGTTLLPGMRVVPDRGGRFCYAAHPHEALKVDSLTGIAWEMQVPPTLPEVSWPMGMAFDSARNRALLVTLGGEGFLYGYAPDLDTWSVVSTMNNYDLDSLVYHPGRDVLFGVGAFSQTLYQFSPQGVFQRQFPLPGLPPFGISGYQTELACAGDFLALLIGPDLVSGDSRPQEWWIYAIDPDSGQCRLSWHQAVHNPPNQAPSVWISQPQDGSTLAANQAAPLTANALDNDGSIHSLEFYVNSRSIGFGTRQAPSSPFVIPWTPNALGQYKLQALATDNDGRTAISPPLYVTVSPPRAMVTWTNPATIVYGTPLSDSELNATANMPGTFVYTPPAGTVLGAGDRTLSVTFSPNDTAVEPVTVTVTQHIEMVPLTIQADNKSKIQGQPNPPLTASYLGFVAGDTPASLDTPVTLSTTATTTSPPGLYPISASGASDGNYNITSYDGTLHVRPQPGGPGSLDLTFDPSRGGRVVGLALGEVELYSMALQPDGRVIIGGYFVGVDGLPRVNLARLNLDGTLDRTFNPPFVEEGAQIDLALQADGKILVSHGTVLSRLNPDGLADTQFAPPPEDRGGVLCVQPDGKILVAGRHQYYDGSWYPNYIDRLNPDGTRDTAFTRRELPQFPRAMVLQADGRIIIGGGLFAPGWISRLHSDGTPDSTFTAAVQGEVYAIALGVGGKILIAGTFRQVNDQERWGVARLNADGSLDLTFNPHISSVDPRIVVYGIGVRPDESIIIAGTSPISYGANSYGYPGYPLLLRLSSAGIEDAAFTSQLGDFTQVPHAQFRALALQPRGRIVAAGNIPDCGLIAVLPNGASDPAFRPSVQGRPGGGDVVTLQRDGRTVVSGNFSTANGTHRPGLARFNADGTLDPTFLPALPGGYRAVTHALQSNGKIVVATGREPYLTGELLRLNSDGTRDPSFAPVARITNTLSRITCVAVQADGRILAAGSHTSVDDVNRPSLIRLNPDGTLDTSFDLHSDLVVPYEYSWLTTLAIQPDSKILIGGYFTSISGMTRHCLARLNSNGSVDETFRAPYFEESGVYYNQVKSIELQPDGRILVGLGVSFEYPSAPILIRLHSNGASDRAFQTGTATAATEYACVSSMAVQPDGKILVAGAFDSFNGFEAPNMVRLLVDGQVDPSFEVSWQIEEQGIQPWEVGEVCGLALQTDGRILMVGWFENIQSLPRWGVARLLNPAPAVPPTIVSQPVDQRVAQGSTATFSVRAVGTEPLTYQWNHDLVPLPSGTNSVLVLANVTSLDAGTYTVRVVNPGGSALSAPATLTVVPCHPADTAPLDWVLRSGEVHAYAAAWRTGGLWSVSPNPIRIDYVTRAAALWKGGQTYRWDSSIPSPPLWWVNAGRTTEPDIQLDKGDEDWAVRRAPRYYVAGQVMEISIRLAAGPHTLARAVEESIPAGWQARTLGDDGELDSGQHQVKWGPFTDVPAHILRYQFLPSRDATGPVRLAGLVSRDGVNRPVGGDAEIRPAGRLGWHHHQSDSKFALELQSDPGTVFIIETSADLKLWTRLTTITNHNGTVEIPVKVTTDPQLYYRARMVEQGSTTE
jgi:uncharacterized delta-60 repeat protein